MGAIDTSRVVQFERNFTHLLQEKKAIWLDKVTFDGNMRSYKKYYDQIGTVELEELVRKGHLGEKIEVEHFLKVYF